MKKIICMILSSVLLMGGIVGCSDGGNTGDMKKISTTTKYVKAERTESVPCYTLSFEVIGGKDVMPIGSRWAPYD